MGRNKKPVTLSKVIKVRFSALDAAIVKRKAKSSGMGMSEYIRRVVFGRVTKQLDPDLRFKLKNYQILAEAKAHLFKIEEVLQQQKNEEQLTLFLKDNRDLFDKIKNHLNSDQ